MHRSLIRPGLLVVLGASLAACAASSTTSGAPGDPQPRNERVRRNPNLITAAEIRSSIARNALEVVQQLRPMWLRTRGVGTVHADEAVFVYYDGVKIGEIGALRDIPTTDVTSMRYLDPASATTKWGVGHTRGVIEVSSRP